ncbi:CHAT domain-containing protein [Acaryochloris sp. IP29b_bin.148]|uniref:CHAT domain-containing protein n=1 Tax=Acaryochloris sp. IP29b_bin.148 TaxID=2969218 RepID=UPI0026107D26|nr:CHAT domain-containing protein [Acaryochloris sp. IP29b_bin.148]
MLRRTLNRTATGFQAGYVSRPRDGTAKQSVSGWRRMVILTSLWMGLGGLWPSAVPAAKPVLSASQRFLAMERSFEEEFEDFFEDDMAEVTQDPKAVAQTLTRISQESGTNPGVIWVIPREDHLHLVLLLPGGKPIVRDLYDVSRAKLLKTVAAFQTQIDNPDEPWNLDLAQQLHQWLIEPFEKKHLQAGDIDTLLFCLGNGLRGLPLAALHDGERYLVEKYSSSNIPAFNLIQTDYKRHQQGKILAAGASEFLLQDPLPSVPTEISAILNFFRTQRLGQAQWQGQLLLNGNFTLQNLKSQLEDQTYNIVHLATHAEFKPGRPRQSYIQLTDTRLRLDEMGSINWSNPSLDLLVLSACKTALGDRTAELGFAGIALRAGVKTALGSLWYVSDVGTLAIMSEFYQQLPQRKTKAEALRQSQLQMLRGQTRIEQGQLILSGSPIVLPREVAEGADIDFSHPFYWSGFTMLSSPW